ncbi:MAG: type II secretion system protein GspD [Gallionellales bacterium CG03_land_8_20_14_0_80_55_15]|nr:MAG: type II secretion system protein GspD [Gallionellales bacterium CG03_land_8_20_14_0_80_55_15]PIV91922.1 MAG: type II secretion system protein GspD [Gallionellales bacterium CG17_big_fil_post_rev_8_21_14_2_50_54_146]PIX04721.1 MAG: type II secretion system protein GspD [Gallionellales bacterium CG_4_8_14_3_um_filter_54_18]PJC04802.1 MAG: type II secretion system protein GspD [Gallionellales bacterium CG_4_9_14_0_8_um_filter_55_61]HCJ51075.1 type II secretion system protein GspD [Gallione
MRIWLVRLMLCGMLVVSSVAISAEEQVSLNFVNADIEEVIKAVSQITKRNFLVDPRVKGSINIVSATPIPASLAYDTLLTALRLQGYAAVESNGVTKVMPEADAKLYIPGIGNKNGNGDKLVTRVFMLHHESAVQLVPILRPLIAPNNIVVAYPNNNALLVTDYASNLKRIEQIVATIDQPNTSAPIVIPVKYASVMDVAQTINRLMLDGSVVATGSTDASQRFMLMADSRTNSLLLSTDSPGRIERVRELVAKLDVKTSAPGNIHVIYLKNAEAAKLALTLRAVLSGDTAATAVASTPPSTSGTPGVAVATNAVPVAGGGIIQADAATNALIITASDAVYNNLRAVVEMLDVRRAQVFVEALIAEVTADKAAEFGIQWQALNGINNPGANVIGGTNFGVAGAGGGNIITAAGNIGTVGQGLNIGIVKGTTTITGLGTVLNLGMLAHFLETDAHANILSTPNLLTLDNEEAKIIIGQNVPFITGSYAQTGAAATATPFQTIERKDVGLTLRIKPQISQGGTVRLQVFQEVSSVQNQTINNAAGVITNKRSLESTVLIEEGQIIVLGGLIQDSVSNGEDKVPLLGDIPLLGNLFRHEARRHTKTNLMVFIRPYVMRDSQEHQGLTQDRYEYLRGEQTKGQFPSRLLLPDIPAPTLPPLGLNAANPQAVVKP